MPDMLGAPVKRLEAVVFIRWGQLAIGMVAYSDDLGARVVDAEGGLWDVPNKRMLAIPRDVLSPELAELFFECSVNHDVPGPEAAR